MRISEVFSFVRQYHQCQLPQHHQRRENSTFKRKNVAALGTTARAVEERPVESSLYNHHKSSPAPRDDVVPGLLLPHHHTYIGQQTSLMPQDCFDCDKLPSSYRYDTTAVFELMPQDFFDFDKLPSFPITATSWQCLNERLISIFTICQSK